MKPKVRYDRNNMCWWVYSPVHYEYGNLKTVTDGLRGFYSWREAVEHANMVHFQHRLNYMG